MFVVTLPPAAGHCAEDFARRARTAGADMLEVRGDLTPNLPPFGSVLPLLVAPRGRAGAWVTQLHPAYIDLELDEPSFACSAISIRSFHDYKRTPGLSELRDIVGRLAGEGCDLPKVATTVRCYQDLVTLGQLQCEMLPRWPMGQIVLGMGPKAHLNRMLSPWRNALTYTCLSATQAVASGQLPLEALARRQLRQPAPGTPYPNHPLIYGILGGENLATRSPEIHNRLFKEHGIDAVYSEFPTSDLYEAWHALNRLGVCALSVTAPFKQSIVRYVDRLEGHAQALKSVNTVVRRDGEWVGLQTDVYGIVAGCPFLRGTRSAVIFGTGGVVPAVIAACRQLGINGIRVLGRNELRLARLGADLDVEVGALQLTQSVRADVWVWAIPADVEVELPAATGTAHAIDLRYGEPSRFLHHASRRGYKTYDGTWMLCCQAREQFRIFTGIDSDLLSPTDLETEI